MTEPANAIIRILGSNAAQATRDARELRRTLLDEVSPGVRIDIVKEQTTTQDTGAALQLALHHGPHVVSVAHALLAFIRRNPRAKIEIETPGGLRVTLDAEVADHPSRLEAIIAALSKNVAGG
ncbi:MAG: hypothetical protein JOZ69_14625 [Myxococcales bacterium]|nr:hypothetical protein [Myxococcales bacterium]